MANSDGVRHVGVDLYSGTRSIPARHPAFAGVLAFAAIAAITCAIYLPGLHGPFLLDDIGNLEPLKRWFDGELGWRAVLLDNRSGPGGRPVSMLSFLFDTWRTGSLDSVGFKTTNLAIHLVTGLMGGVLAWQVFNRTLPDRRMAWIGTVFVTATWLWMPIQVSTVLYTVQRMAQLAALFTFATLALYLHARARLPDRRHAPWLLWLGVPFLAGVATLAKENGALAMPLVAVLEFTLYPPGRPRSVRVFLGLTVALPLLGAAIFLAIRPDWIMRGYAIRDFTLEQRLLTEPRILWSYLQTSFFPVGPRMGLFHDNLTVSTGLLTPWTTLVAIVAWITAIVASWVYRRRLPLLALGVAGYLVGVSMESGPIALELYFEHRNYGPVFFAIIAIVGLALPGISRLKARPSVRRLVGAVATLCLFVYALGTWNQAQGWSDERTFYAVQYNYNPTSPRVLSNLTARAMQAGDLAQALHFIDAGEHEGPPSEYATATLWRVLAYCNASGSPSIPPQLYDELDERAKGRITTYAMVAWDLVANRLSEGCGTLDRARVIAAGLRWLHDTPQAPQTQYVWRTRYNVGRIIAANGDIPHARDTVARAWQDSEHNNGIGVLLFQLDASLGDIDACRRVLSILERQNNGDDKRLDDAVRTFREALEHGEIGKNA